MSETDAVVQVDGLTKVYRPTPTWTRMFLRTQVTSDVIALDDVSFKLAPHEILTIAGPNGAGKSTLFRVLTGLVSPTGGSVTVVGYDGRRQSRSIRASVGYVAADDRALWLRQTCKENLVFRGMLQGMERHALAERVDEVLELVGLSHAKNRAGFALSSGMRSRLQIAAALIHSPPLLILDEPTGPVDPVGAYELLESIRQLAAETGVAVLMSTHRVEEIEAFGDNVLLMHQGQVLHSGTIDALHAEWTRPQLKIGFRSEAAARSGLTRLEALTDHPLRLDGTTVVASGADTTAGALLAALDGQVADVHDVSESYPPLRELLATVLSDDPSDE